MASESGANKHVEPGPNIRVGRLGRSTKGKPEGLPQPEYRREGTEHGRQTEARKVEVI